MLIIIIVARMLISIVIPWFSYPKIGMDLFLKHWTERVTVGLINVEFVFSIMLLYREGRGFAADCHCVFLVPWINRVPPLYGSTLLKASFKHMLFHKFDNILVSNATDGYFRCL